jgi:hypothetical protein
MHFVNDLLHFVARPGMEENELVVIQKVGKQTGGCLEWQELEKSALLASRKPLERSSCIRRMQLLVSLNHFPPMARTNQLYNVLRRALLNNGFDHALLLSLSLSLDDSLGLLTKEERML